MKNANLQSRAEKILKSIEDDVELIPSNIANWWVNYLHNHRHRYLDTLSFLSEDDRKKKILEVGSVPGHFTILLKRLGYDIHGIDIEPNRVKKLWDNYDIIVNKVDIEKDFFPFQSNSFDIVFYTEVIEHLRLNPLHSLREVYRISKPTGRIILSTPNITPVDRLNFLFGRDYQGNPVEEFKKLEWLGHMGHIRLYSLNEVKGFLEYVGFRICKYTYKGEISLRSWKTKFLKIIYPKKEHFHKFLYIIAAKS